MVAARELMSTMDSQLPTDYLYGKARGKMFGVLSCRNSCGEIINLKAFSGQYDGRWEMAGWAPPLFEMDAFKRTHDPVELKIKALGREAAATDNESQRTRILAQRKQLSRDLMKSIHALYRLHNFKGRQCALTDLFAKDRGIPTGSGDCCAPKLLNFAARQGLQPLGLLEFFWGKSNRSASRHEGQFYLACTDKCGPILGFLLCGVDSAANKALADKDSHLKPPHRPQASP
jgi:hypothetical protein